MVFLWTTSPRCIYFKNQCAARTTLGFFGIVCKGAIFILLAYMIFSNNAAPRDFLQWPGASQENAKDGVPVNEAPSSDDLHGRLTSVLRVFCPSLNCLSPLCITHGGEYLANHVN